jgi:hypothetical protein
VAEHGAVGGGLEGGQERGGFGDVEVSRTWFNFYLMWMVVGGYGYSGE